MEIKLNDKIYKLKKIKALMVRKSIEITESIDFNKITTKDLGTLIDFIVDLYGNEFTREDVYEGLEAKELLPTIKGTMDSVVNGINAEVSKVEKKVNGESKPVTLEEFVYDTYLNLLEQSIPLNDIDEMDFIFYVRLMVYRTNKQEEENVTYIDTIGI